MNALGPMLLGLLLLAGAAAQGSSFMRMCSYNARRTAYIDPDLPSVDPSTFDANLCTDAVWNHGYIDLENKTIRQCRNNDTVCETNFENFRKARDNMFIWMSIDGVDLEGKQKDPTKTFFIISNRASDRNSFAKNAAFFLKKEGMDGLVIDWEFPTRTTHTDTIFVEFLKAINDALRGNAADVDGVYVAVIAPSNTKTIINYNLKAVHPHVNFLIIKAYDQHLTSRTILTHSSPLFPAPEDHRQGTPQNLNASLTSYLSKTLKVPRDKIVVGLSWKAVVYFIDTGAPFIPGSPGRLQTVEPTTSRLVQGMALDEVCALHKQKARVLYDSLHQVPYLVFKDYWVSYEDVRSVTEKVNLTISLGLQGVMIEDVEMDDVKGTQCGNGSYPLLHIVQQTVMLMSEAKLGSGATSARLMWNGSAAPFSLHLGLWLGYLLANLTL